MAGWSLADVNWQAFDKTQAEPGLVHVIKAASLVEYNSGDYARYLIEVFPDDLEFQHTAEHWAQEDTQHGEALRKWAELADPGFNFEERFRRFTRGYSLPRTRPKRRRNSAKGKALAERNLWLRSPSMPFARGSDA